MKKILLTFLFCFLISANLKSQWNEVYSTSHAFQLSKFEFINEMNGFAIGVFLLKTSNAGLSWQKLDSGNFTDIQFLNEMTGFISKNINDTGYFLKTTDGGNVWQENRMPVPGKL